VDRVIETFDVALPHGITLACRATGARGAPRVMLLHGFPEAAFVWDAVMERLAPQARCIAPDQRGYRRSSAPPAVADYRARHLVADLEALITATGGPLDVLVAHDWGGAVAWSLAAQKPQLLRQLVIVNAPHPATFLRELRDNPDQQAASAYMNFLCRPDAERLLAENDYQCLWPFFTTMGTTGWLDETQRARYREAWGHGLSGALNWYRASPLRPPVSAADPIHALQLPDELVTVGVPTTVIWGEEDAALLPGLLDGLDRWVPQLRLVRVPGASHWIVHEQPALVTDEIVHALRSAAAGG
jgi:pimeloyl-ACP methyl ester carboxylesterase